ncbi:MAG: hypothetical protein AAF399_06665 [Bacteroidota bacterium]
MSTYTLTATTVSPAKDIHRRRYRAYALKKTAKMIGVISLGIIGLLFLSVLLLFR